MDRKNFIKSVMAGAAGESSLSSFHTLTSGLKENGKVMPVLFIGHGSPMNGIENNEFSNGWKKTAEALPTPTAILVISAHWYTKGTRVTTMDFPETIHDFGDFPKRFTTYNIRLQEVRNWLKKLLNSSDPHLSFPTTNGDSITGPGSLPGTCIRMPTSP